MKKLTQGQKALWDKVFSYTLSCPEDIFGPSYKDTKVFKKNISSLDRMSERITRKRWTDEVNDWYQRQHFRDLYSFLRTWALWKIECGTYGDRSDFVCKIRLLVKNYNDKKLFFLEDAPKGELYFDSLSSIHFEGYGFHDRITVLRDGKSVKKGAVIYTGTHAAQELFHWEDSKTESEYGSMTSSLKAKDLEVGDIVEIETKKYFSPKRFGVDLMRFHSLSISLMDAFKTNNNKLGQSELRKAVKKADTNTTKEFKDKEVFVLTDG